MKISTIERDLAISQTLGEPDPFRFKYRLWMKLLVNELIKNPKNKKKTLENIESWVKSHVHAEDQSTFITMIESELYSLHMGNIARYKVNLSEFKAWKESWS